MQKTVFFQFTNVYQMQDFSSSFFSAEAAASAKTPAPAQMAEVLCIDCQDLSGVDCYCCEESEALLREKIKDIPSQGVHFLDSGNYHYLSKLWMEKVQEPFALILFDNHTDMQSPGLFDMLTCGSWVKYALESNPFLKAVCIVGPPADACARDLELLAPDQKERIFCISREQMGDTDQFSHWLSNHASLPFYLSVDKDILCTEDAITNWDQGTCSLTQLLSLLALIPDTMQCVGADICGEYGQDIDVFEQNRAAAINSMANERLYQQIVTKIKLL